MRSPIVHQCGMQTERYTVTSASPFAFQLYLSKQWVTHFHICGRSNWWRSKSTGRWDGWGHQVTMDHTSTLDQEGEWKISVYLSLPGIKQRYYSWIPSCSQCGQYPLSHCPQQNLHQNWPVWCILPNTYLWTTLHALWQIVLSRCLSKLIQADFVRISTKLSPWYK